MKIYVAGKFEKKDLILDIYEKIKKLGHEVSYDWTTHKPIKPYNENKEIAQKYTQEDIDGVRDCDVFIFIIDEALGTGMHVELGAAITLSLEKGKPQIYVVGEDISKSMFYFHQKVNQRKDINEVLEELK
ncbi:nucleoside 2-deoxyribosyltransferase [archaeon]|nr:nucleoside 2-deoxyribosyltransferase [archaeon]